MAKAKKSESTPKKEPAKKPAAKSKAATPGGALLIDTNLAAQNAARMLAAGMNKTASGGGAVQPESAMFKQLKAGMNKPAIGSLASPLNQLHGSDSTKGGNGFKQSSQGASYNANVAKTGVPRRNPG